MWAKLDDNFSQHPKIVRAGPLAGWLFICGLCYSNRHLTNGKIPKGAVSTLADYSHIGVEMGGVPGLVGVGEDVTPDWCAYQLTSQGLWEDKGDHFLIHDFTDYNFTKRQVQILRAQWKRRQAKHRAKMSQRDSRVSHPLPVPVLSSSKTKDI